MKTPSKRRPREDAPAAKFEIYLDDDNEWRWQLRARNGKIIGDSGEGYKRREGCLAGIELVRGAKVVEVRVR